MNTNLVQRNIRWLITLCVAALLAASVPAPTSSQTPDVTMTPASQQLAQGPKDGFCG